VTPGEQERLDVDQIRRELAGAPDAERLQPLGLGRVVTGLGALDELASLVAGLRRPSGDVVVLAAATPMSAGGRDLRDVVEAALGASSAVDWVVLRPEGRTGAWPPAGPVGAAGGPPGEAADGLVHADEPTVAAAAAATAGAGCVITIGSGTVTDIGKAAAPGAAPLVAVQTATSVNGYADPFSVLLHRGVKRTVPSRWPDALIIDPDVLLDAPPELNRAGAGDMMAMFTSIADWYLASAVRGPGRAVEMPGHDPGGGADDGPGERPGDPPYHSAVARLVQSRGPRLLELAAGLNSPAADPLAELADLLTLSGIAMGVAGSTAPASGMEHAISHLLEMAATAAGRPANLHGTQVGVASVVAARTWDHVLARIADGGLDRAPALPDPDTVRDRMVKEFAAVDPSGAMAAECFADYARKLRRLGAGSSPGSSPASNRASNLGTSSGTRSGADRGNGPQGPGTPLSVLRAAWTAHRGALDGLLLGPEAVAAALRSAGLPVRFCDLAEPVDDATARWAVANCALQRQRFCVADLAMLLGVWQDDDVDEVLAGTVAGTGPP
jgi:glycerol-1-phosphate dehydrogenase [NAD(P)+]